MLLQAARRHCLGVLASLNPVENSLGQEGQCGSRQDINCIFILHSLTCLHLLLSLHFPFSFFAQSEEQQSHGLVRIMK